VLCDDKVFIFYIRGGNDSIALIWVSREAISCEETVPSTKYRDFQRKRWEFHRSNASAWSGQDNRTFRSLVSRAVMDTPLPLSVEEVSVLNAKYSEFVTRNLEPRLKELMQTREELVEVIESYEEVVHVVEHISKSTAGGSETIGGVASIDNGIVVRKLVDIGCGVACQAVSISTDRMVIDIGMGSFVELLLPEVLVVSKERQTLLSDKVALLDGDISDCIADIEETLASLSELKKLSGGIN